MDCSELGKTLKEVMEVGDLVRFHAVRLEGAEAGEERDIRYLSTGLIAAKTPEKLKRMKFPGDLDHVVSLDQVTTEKIDNWKKVVGIMNGIKVRTAEQKILKEIESGLLASKVMKLPAVSDKMLQESDDENEASKKNSLAEEAKIREKVKKKANDGKNQDNKNKKDDDKKKEEEPQWPKVDYKDITNLAEEMKPKELRKIIMAYIGAITNLPESPEKRVINVEAIVAGVNTEKDLDFLAEFFVSLGQNCLRAEKGFKVGHMLVTMAQVKTIRTRGVLVKEDIVNGPVPEKVEEKKVDKPQPEKKVEKPQPKEVRIANVETVKESNVEKKSNESQEIEEVVLLDSDDDEPKPTNTDSEKVDNMDQTQSLDQSKPASDAVHEPDATLPLETDNDKTESVESEKEKETESNKTTAEKEPASELVEEEQPKSVLEKHTVPQLRMFLKHFIKMIDSDSKIKLDDVATEIKMEVGEVRNVAIEMTRKCAETAVVDGKRQSFKLQGIFLNSNLVEKIVKFDFK